MVALSCPSCKFSKGEKLILNIIQGILVFILITTIIGLPIFILYKYNPDLAHQHQTLCTITNCTAYTYQCCGTCGAITHSSCNCATCTNYNVNLTLDLNGTFYDKILSYGTCGIEKVYCYYDDQNIYPTLSLDPLEPPVSVVGIHLIAVFMFFVLLGIIIMGCCLACNAIKYND